MAWAQLIGAGIQYEGQSREDTRKRELAQRQGSVVSQMGQLGAQDDASTIAQLRALQLQRAASYRQLADSIGSPARNAAGDAGRAEHDARLQTALSGIPAAATRPGSQAYDGWGAQASANYSPMMQAKLQLLAEQNAQGAMGRYDQSALNNTANTGIDISRRAQEIQQNSNYLAAMRQRMLAEAGLQNADNGPGQGYYNAMLLGNLANIGGQVYSAYGDRQSTLQADGTHLQNGGGGMYYSDAYRNTGPNQLSGPPALYDPQR